MAAPFFLVNVRACINGAILMEFGRGGGQERNIHEILPKVSKHLRKCQIHIH